MHDADDLASLTIRELLAELTRLEERLNSRRAAAGYQANSEISRLEHHMRAIRAELRQRRTGAAGHDSESSAYADEADRLEQLIAVDTSPDEEYPHQQEVDDQ